jgi:hypothetical protein
VDDKNIDKSENQTDIVEKQPKKEGFGRALLSPIVQRLGTATGVTVA